MAQLVVEPGPALQQADAGTPFHGELVSGTIKGASGTWRYEDGTYEGILHVQNLNANWATVLIDYFIRQRIIEAYGLAGLCEGMGV